MIFIKDRFSLFNYLKKKLIIGNVNELLSKCFKQPLFVFSSTRRKIKDTFWEISHKIQHCQRNLYMHIEGFRDIEMTGRRILLILIYEFYIVLQI